MRKLQSALSNCQFGDNLILPKVIPNAKPLEAILYDSQVRWLTDNSPLMIADKGRQVGFSWTDSLKSVRSALKGESTYYTSFNKDTTENYIRYCVKWAKALNHIVKVTHKAEFINSRDTLIYRVKFNNGSSITALAGNAVNLRDKAGHIVIDEAAFRQNLEQIMDAALAILIWGGTVRLFSTHFGADSYFNQLINEARSREFSRHHIPFRKALREGLYKRVCTRKGVIWTQEDEDEWVESLYTKYGVGASQELDCIPSEDSGLGLFKNPRFITSRYDDNLSRFLVRSWDLAATEKDGCYSVGSLLSYSVNDNLFIVEDIKAGQWNPIEGDRILVQTAKDDGLQTHLLIEQEGGSEAIRWKQYIENQLAGHYVDFKKPETNKLSRAVPLANAILNGELVFLDTPNNREMVAQLSKFSEKPKPLVTDLVDSLSQGYSYLRSMFFDTGMLGT